MTNPSELADRVERAEGAMRCVTCCGSGKVNAEGKPWASSLRWHYCGGQPPRWCSECVGTGNATVSADGVDWSESDDGRELTASINGERQGGLHVYRSTIDDDDDGLWAAVLAGPNGDIDVGAFFETEAEAKEALLSALRARAREGE